MSVGTRVQEAARGRVLSVWSMIAAGVTPLGSLLLSGLASLVGRVTYVIIDVASVALVAAGQAPSKAPSKAPSTGGNA